MKSPDKRRHGCPGCLECGGTGYIQKKVECGNCDGEGQAECPHCGSDTECEECDGTGWVEEDDVCGCWDTEREYGDNFGYLERTASDAKGSK